MSEFVEHLELSIYQFTTDYIKKLFRDINTNLLRKFNNGFKKEGGGNKSTNRNWRDIEEGKIRELYEENKKEIESCISEFKFIKIPRKTSNNGSGKDNANGIYLLLFEM